MFEVSVKSLPHEIGAYDFGVKLPFVGETHFLVRDLGVLTEDEMKFCAQKVASELLKDFNNNFSNDLLYGESQPKQPIGIL